MDRSKNLQHDLAARLDDAVLARLRGLRGAIRRRLLAEGVAWLLIALVGAVLATLALDWLLRLDRPQRAFVSGVAAVLLVRLLWVRVARPLRVAMGPLDLSLLVERRFPHLQGRLASAVAFAAAPLPAGANAAMVSRVAADAAEMVGDLRFTEVVERRNLWRAWRIALCAVGLVVGLTIWQSDLMRLWAARNVLLTNAAWPQNTYLSIEGEDFTVVRGDDLRVMVRVEAGSETPPHVTAHARYPTVGWTAEQVGPAEENGGRFEIVFEQVVEPFEFYVVGGDDKRDKRMGHRVSLVEPPAVRLLAFTIESPDYMRRQDRPVEGSSAVLAVPVGSTLRIDGESTKDLAEAVAVITDAAGGESTVELERLDLPDGRRGLSGRLAMPTVNDPQQLSLRLILTDRGGIASRRSGKVVIRVQPDLPPGLELRKTGVGPSVTPSALLPLLVAAKDDAGIASVSIGLRLDSAESPLTTQAVAVPSGEDPITDLSTRQELDLAGRGLEPGQGIVVWAEGVDTLPEELSGPNRQNSNSLTFQIVSPEDLWAGLINRQKVLRTELLQTRSRQEKAVGETTSAGESLSGDGTSAAAYGRLLTSAGIQSSVRADVAAAAEKLRLIADEMTYNRLGRSADVDVLRQGVIEPLDELDDEIELVTAELQTLVQGADTADMADRAADIARRQTEIGLRMDEILDQMVKLHSRQELANQLRIILQWSREISSQIETKRQAEINEVLGDDETP